VAANLDRLVVVASLADPPFRAGLVDRFLVAAGMEGIEGAVCLNKVDLEGGRDAGAGALELGYWLRSDYSGRGIATACAAALTSAALALPGVSRVEIHCDEANVRSASLARRLGYQLVRIEDDEIAAPGETGRNMIWTYSGA
jgi:RimJ/RimL family protein N-acetyltransferase